MKKENINNKRRGADERTRFVLCAVLFLFSGVLMAQQEPIYSQYTFNGFLLNPAVAGAEGYTAINASAREQWLGVEGAPSTQSISIQTRIMKRDYIETNASVKRRYVRPLRSGRVGLGFYIYKDHSGLNDQTGAQFTYAYHIYRNTSQLSFGVTFSIFQFKVNTLAMRLPDAKDNLIDNEPMQMIIPDAKAGIYYTDLNKFLGISVLNLTRASIMFGRYKAADFRMERQINVTGGYEYDLDDTYTLEPSLYLKTSEQWKLQADVMAKLICDKKFWLGIGYRDVGTFIGTIGFKVNVLYFGYSYDYSPSGLSMYSYGTHELMLALKLGDNVRRYRWMERY